MLDSLKKTAFIIVYLLVGLNSYSQTAISYFNQASELHSNGEYTKSNKNLDKAIAMLQGTNPRIQSLKVYNYYYKGEYIKASTEFETYLKIIPLKYQKTSNHIALLSIGEDINKQIDIMEDAFRLEHKKKVVEEKKQIRKELKSDEATTDLMIKNSINKLSKSIKAGEFEPTYSKWINLLDKIENGRPYKLKNYKRLTKSTKEVSFVIFYGKKFIIYTIPDKELVSKLFKDNITYKSYDATYQPNKVETAIDKQKLYFLKSIFYSNIFYGGNGDELLLSGTHNTKFEKLLYYYYYSNTKYVDVSINPKFDPLNYNPYMRVGESIRKIDFDYVTNEKLKNNLKRHGFINKKATNSAAIFKFIPKKTVMIIPTKNASYTYNKNIKGKLYKNKQEYKGQWMHYKKVGSTTYYGFLEYVENNETQFYLSSIGFDSDNKYRMSETLFNSVYNSINNNKTRQELRRFTSSGFKSFFEDILSMLSFTNPTKASYSSTASSNKPKTINLNDSEVYTVVETMPEFPGGNKGMSEFINSNIEYPSNARESGIQGSVFVKFVVAKNGEVVNSEVIRSVNNELDTEALRVINLMPNWKPGLQKGKAVNVSMAIPVKFQTN